ncbi:hypothetical protein TIFTF001_027525 [Ficus carica]|uniref:Uncharacterized protein n=1 Tax=Ficus carica TaxID=3494 RepID=A0AA88IZR5_FICCA|nr:hypothetical protein TIFTF001_027525 [Ficus carica]
MVALMKISSNYGPQCHTNEAHANQAFLENVKSMTFTDEDMEVAYPDHKRPLYLEAWVNYAHVRRALLGTGSSVNVIPLTILTATRIPRKRITKMKVKLLGFGNSTETSNDVSYHDLLGRPWINKHKLICSTDNQCVKVQLGTRVIHIAANQTLFDQTEAHFVDVEFYDDFAIAGESSIGKPSGTQLSAWEKIKELDDEDL